MKLNSHKGPINKNCKSFKNDGFLPSMLCPINCPTHARAKIIIETSHKGGVSSFAREKFPKIKMAVTNSMPIVKGVDKVE